MTYNSELTAVSDQVKNLSFAQDSGKPTDQPFTSLKTIEDLAKEAKNSEMIPRRSETYLEAKRLGLNVMFVCFQGQERSPQSSKKALRRGETDTTFLRGGTDQLYDRLVTPVKIKVQAQHMAFGRLIPSEEQKLIEAEITSQAAEKYRQWVQTNLSAKYFVRVFTDERSDITAFFIDALKAESIPYEEVSILQIKAENLQLNTPREGFEEDDKDDVI